MDSKSSNPSFQPQAPSSKLQAQPPDRKKNQTENPKIWPKNIEKSRQKSFKNHKNHKKTKNAKSKIKVSKSLANPNTNQMLKQIQSKCKENHRNSKNQHFWN